MPTAICHLWFTDSQHSNTSQTAVQTSRCILHADSACLCGFSFCNWGGQLLLLSSNSRVSEFRVPGSCIWEVLWSCYCPCAPTEPRAFPVSSKAVGLHVASSCMLLLMNCMSNVQSCPPNKQCGLWNARLFGCAC